MLTIIIHNLDPETYRALKAQAEAAGHCVEAEVRHILDRAVFSPDRPINLGTLLAEIGRQSGGVELDIERGEEERTPDFS